MRAFEFLLFLVLLGLPVGLWVLAVDRFIPQSDCSGIQSPILKPFCELGNEFSGL